MHKRGNSRDLRVLVGLRGQTQRRRVLRGGAFNNNENNVRCAVRNRNNPNNRNRNNGFRVVASTIFVAGMTFLPELPDGAPSLSGRGEK